MWMVVEDEDKYEEEMAAGQSSPIRFWRLEATSDAGDAVRGGRLHSLAMATTARNSLRGLLKRSSPPSPSLLHHDSQPWQMHHRRPSRVSYTTVRALIRPYAKSPRNQPGSRLLRRHSRWCVFSLSVTCVGAYIGNVVAGMAAVTVGYPFDTGQYPHFLGLSLHLIFDAHPVKVRFQNPLIASKYRSTAHAFLTIIREERIRGLYRGIAAPLVRIRTRKAAEDDVGIHRFANSRRSSLSVPTTNMVLVIFRPVHRRSTALSFLVIVPS